MSAKPMTPSEVMVGRRLPAAPRHLDIVLAGYVSADGTFRACLPPVEDYLRPAFRTARKRGLVRQTSQGLSIMGGKPEFYWELTDKGRAEATVAAGRVKASEEARRQWSRDWDAANRARRQA